MIGVTDLTRVFRRANFTSSKLIEKNDQKNIKPTLKVIAMKKSSEQTKKLTLGRTTIALLNGSWSKRQGVNQWHFPTQVSSIPPVCDVTNTGAGVAGF